MPTLIMLVLVVAVALAAASDLRSRRIPNWLTLGALIAACGLRVLMGGPALVEGLLGVGLAFVIVVPLFAMGGIGGGDAKLLMVVGAFLGPMGFGIALAATAMVGGLMSVVAATRRGVILPALLSAVGLMKYVLTLGRAGERTTLMSPDVVSVPYGVAIAVGSVVALYLGGGIS